MLPPVLEGMRSALKSNAGRNQVQSDLLHELDAVSHALDAAQAAVPSIAHGLERKPKPTFGVWGGPPGACPNCGKVPTP